MSGLSGLANWALSGGAGNNSGRNGNDGNAAAAATSSSSSSNNETPLTQEEIHARRMARIEAMQKRQDEASAAAPTKSDGDGASKKDTGPEPMDIDDKVSSPSPSTDTAMETDRGNVTPKAAAQPVQKKAKSTGPTSGSSVVKSIQSPLDPARKLQRKKELLIRKTMQVTIGPNQTDSASIPLELDGTASSAIDVATISEIFATRLALEPSELKTTTPEQKPLMQYLAG